MPAPRVLFVKLSSLGDVVHHLPAVTDLRRHRPDLHVAWAVEEAYAPLVRLHPGVDEVIPVALRALRDSPASTGRWSGLRSSRRTVARGGWDYVIDTQGLLKSAWIARGARAATFGFDRHSARERLAARFYDVKFRIPRELHAVERNRRLVGEVFGHGTAEPADYGLQLPDARPPWAPQGAYAVLLHAASRADKLWAQARWIALGRMLADSGHACVLPSGNPRERTAAERIAAQIPGALVAPPMALDEAASLLAHAEMVAGVDTGLAHLAVALRRPTVGIYCATRAELTGLHGNEGVNLGSPGKPPEVEAVAAALGYPPRFPDAPRAMAQPVPIETRPPESTPPYA